MNTLVAGYVLVLIYGPSISIVVEPRDDLPTCVADARKKLGSEMYVLMWDSLGGSNPIPRVMAAFCAEGGAIK